MNDDHFGTQKIPQTLVTLVTPAFNQAEYLPQTLESVLRLQYTNLEYLVIDDGSTDDTATVLRRYVDKINWKSQPNMGQSRTLNKGWAEAKGDIIGYISSDDLLEPNAVLESVRALTDHPEAILVYCDFELIDPQGLTIRTVRTRDFSERTMVEDLVCFPGPGAFFRRSAFLKAGGWDEDLHQIPDFDFWLRLFEYGCFLRIPQVLAKYRIHDSSASFRPTTIARSNEIIAVTETFWLAQGVRLHTKGYSKSRSLSMAHLLAARSHFASARLCHGMYYVVKAWKLAPIRLLNGLAWRILFGGLLRRPVYTIRMLLKRRPA